MKPASVWRLPHSYDPMTVLVVIAGLTMLVLAMMPPVRTHNGSAAHEQCRHNLKRIGAALHLYHARYNSFPPAIVADKSGRGLYGWRVLILPYLGEQQLYDRFDLSAAWDAPQNRYVLEHMPDVFCCPSGEHHSDDYRTDYAGVSGAQTVFEGTRPVHSLEVSDGLSRTLMVVEASNASIPWTSPRDVNASTGFRINVISGASSKHPGGAYALTVDEGVHFLDEKMRPSTLRKISARDDGVGLIVNENR